MAAPQRNVNDEQAGLVVELSAQLTALRAELEQERRMVADLRARETALSLRVDELAVARSGTVRTSARKTPTRRARAGGLPRRARRLARRVLRRRTGQARRA